VTGSILVVEDDPTIAAGLERALKAQGYEARVVGTAQGALHAVTDASPDLVLLDLGLPDGDGIDVCRQLTNDDPTLPVIILTARREEIDIVVGLDAGAVDYVIKPFRLAELLARVRAALRRVDAPAEADVLVVGDVEIDRTARRVTVQGDEIELRAKEYDLLVALLTNAGKAMARDELMHQVWDEHWWGSTKTLDVHIASLRRRLGEQPGDPSRITTLRGVGYRYELA
jgi:DNA-binding response OmpR family regulator